MTSPGRPIEPVEPATARELKWAGTAMQKAQTAVEEAVDRFDQAVATGHYEGVPIRRMAEIAGVDRKTVYKSLRRQGLHQTEGSIR